jgi:hypothetical protein
VFIKIGKDLGQALAADVIGRCVEMVMDREQLALDEIGLNRPAQPDRHIGLAHGEIKLAVFEQQHDADFRIKVDELGDARRQPYRAEADRGGDAQFARRLVLGIHEPRLGGGKLGEYIMRSAVEHLALLGQNQATGVAMKQRNVQLLLQRADLPAHGRLREAKLMAGMSEAAGISDGMKNPQAIPIHGIVIDLRVHSAAA